MDREPLIKWFSVYLKGLAMGCAHAIPGVSGGTIALITGIYERLITAITSISIVKITDYFVELDDYSLTSLKTLVHKMDLLFLTVLGLGVFTAVLAVLRSVNYLLITYPIMTYGALSGLIAVSAIILYREVDISGRDSKIAALSGFLLAFAVSGYLATSISTSLPIIFISGLLAVSALILPGISGSLILVILGQYAYMVGAISDLLDAFIEALSSGQFNSVIDATPPVLVFMFGALTGLFTISHIVKWAMDRKRQVTMAFLVSLILGGMRAPIAETGRIINQQGATWSSAAPEFLLASFLGGISIILLDRYTAGIKID